MSTKVEGLTVSAKKKGDVIKVIIRRTTQDSMEISAAAYEDAIKQGIPRKYGMAQAMHESAHSACAQVDFAKITPTAWRIIDAQIKEIELVHPISDPSPIDRMGMISREVTA